MKRHQKNLIINTISIKMFVGGNNSMFHLLTSNSLQNHLNQNFRGLNKINEIMLLENFAIHPAALNVTGFVKNSNK